MDLLSTRHLAGFVCLLVLLSVTRGVDARSVHVKDIEIVGNKKTKTALILREIDFKEGDSILISNLTNRLERNEQLLMNTGLFNDVELNITDWPDQSKDIAISLKVVESWYIFPLPIFNLADRNLNVWWTEHNHSLKRVNYGLRFVYVNFTGNKDNLKLTLQSGYTRKVLLQYDRPYINRRKTIGITGRFFFDHRREFPYNTFENKRTFFKDDNAITFKSLKTIVSLHYRPRVTTFHELLMKFERNKVTDQILDLNTSYFNGKTDFRFFELSYKFTREKRDSRFYALKGNFWLGQIQKEGLGIFDDYDKFTTSLFYAHYVPIRHNLNLELRAKVQKEWTGNRHPYYGLEALGFGEDYIRGYELYVVDGTDFVLSRNSLRFNLLNRSFDLKKKMPVDNYRILPVQIWLTANLDLGRATNTLYQSSNSFANRWLVGRGLGLDIILYQKYVFQIEYSFNHLNEKGLFLHVRSDF